MMKAALDKFFDIGGTGFPSLGQNNQVVRHSLERLCHQPIPPFRVSGVSPRLRSD